jgi:hypothetical protein
MEAGQLINRHLVDIDTIDPALRTDLPYNTYVQDLTGLSGNYENALAQIRQDEETKKIGIADNGRDKSLSFFSWGLKMYSVSDEPDEVEASRGLQIVYRNFKDIAKLNYEAESMAIDKLVIELEKPQHAAKVAKLGMERHVARIKSTNETFKALFGGRMVENSMTEVFDMKIVRKETFAKYGEFCAYVLAMAKAHNDLALFTDTLKLLNGARKYYADLLARRNSKGDKETPLT